MKRIYSILFFLFLWSEVFPQITNSYPINQTRILAVREAKFTLNYADVEGSPYYTSDFIKGVAYLKDGNYAVVPVRYDIFRDEIEFLKENKIYWLKKGDIMCVRIGPDSLLLTCSISDTSKPGYFFLKNAGSYKLLCKKIVGYYPEVPAKGYAATVPARFKHESDEFYIQFEDKPAWKVKNKKDLPAIFANNKPALDYIKKEKINPARPEDIEKLIIFLNSK